MSNILHVYGQVKPGYNVEIAGDIESLVRLRDTINDALLHGQEGRNHYTNDGNDFTVYVSCYSVEGMNTRSLPYFETK
jgi:hypothetical protein